MEKVSKTCQEKEIDELGGWEGGKKGRGGGKGGRERGTGWIWVGKGGRDLTDHLTKDLWKWILCITCRKSSKICRKSYNICQKSH